MSRAGKFIPGGTGRKTTALGNRTGPIRAPVAEGAAAETQKAAKPSFGKGSGLIKPVPKNRRIPIMAMSAVVCCLLVSFAWYELAVLPAQRAVREAQQKAEESQKALADALAAQKKHEEELAKQQAAIRVAVTVDSKPQGATVTIGDSHLKTPANFPSVVPGKVTVTIQADGYEDYSQEVTIPADKPTDLGVIELAQKAGNLSLTTTDADVTYTLTGPGGYSHEGQLPEKLEKLPAGDYQLTVSQHDWKLPPMLLGIHDKDDVKKEIKFPFASLTITSVPPGATLRNGHTVIGKTPLTLEHLRPGTLNLSADLVPYSIERFTVDLPESGKLTKDVSLQAGKDFVSASGIPMVWIPDGNFWAGKYEVRQGEYEKIVGSNPSTFRRPNRPVETISWEAANAFCDKLTQYEKKNGKLPDGYHYALPTESQWSLFTADASLDQAVMSRVTSLSSTQDAGSSEPNKYGLYDTIGNVWEWCSDLFDDRGDHSLRGGSWLSSPDNFPGPDTRSAGGPKYADRFTGFRVVLVPN